MPINVLYIDGDGPLGGASRSLYEAVRGLPKGSVDPYFLVARGTASIFYERVARDIINTRGISKFDNTQYGHYRGIRWLILLREIFYFPYTIHALLKARFKWRMINLIHVNEYVYIFPALIAKIIFNAPLIVHVRSLPRIQDNSLRTRFVNKLMARFVDAVVAIDYNIQAPISKNMSVEVIHNSFRSEKLVTPDYDLEAQLDTLRSNALIVGFVGNLHHAKGLFDIFEAAKIVRNSGRNVEFVIVGGVTLQDEGIKAWLLKRLSLAQNIHAELKELIKKENLTQCFHLMGGTLDIKRAYDRFDVLLHPGHADAPGRPVFEAAFSSVPSIVSVSHPFPDTLVPGETGIAIPPKSPEKLAEAILYFADNPSEAIRMGKNAKVLAEANFNPEMNSRKLLMLYKHVINNEL